MDFTTVYLLQIEDSAKTKNRWGDKAYLQHTLQMIDHYRSNQRRLIEVTFHARSSWPSGTNEEMWDSADNAWRLGLLFRDQ